MSYYYAECQLLGKIIAVGGNLLQDKAQWLNKRVFTFSPHSSHIVTDYKSVMLIPDNIESIDAVFMPTIETAISLVMSSKLLIGEKIGIIGQGLIGLFVAKIIQLQVILNNSLYLIDVNEKRLNIASEFIQNCHCYNPLSSHDSDYQSSLLRSFDAIIEVSGHPSGLQTAIDLIGCGGRLIIGSLYGEKLVPLHLGLSFHRRNLQIVTSQVSNIPSELTARWDKQRRFDLTWKIIDKIKPSSLLNILRNQNSELIQVRMNNDDIRMAYQSLNNSKATVIVIKY